MTSSVSKFAKNRIGFIGGGNMASAIISGLISSGLNPQNIMVSDPNEPNREYFIEQNIQATKDSAELIMFADIIVLAIKPQLFGSVLPDFSGMFNDKLVISVAAGITIDTIISLIDHDNIVRCMPNTPALIQQGATGLYANDNVDQQDRNSAKNILSATGLVIWVNNENDLHAVTAISGSAPAYFFYVMESMIEAGESLGLTREQASQLTLQTAYGSAKMAKESQDSPANLRAKVTSPNGTTHAAIESMKANNLTDIIAKGMQACVERSKEMARGE